MTNQFQEPPIHPLDDTHPTQTVPLVSFDEQGNIVREVPMWRRAFGLVSLLGAFGLTIATVLVLLTADGSSGDPTPVAPTQEQEIAQVATNTPETLPTITPEDDTPPAETVNTQAVILPTLDPETAQNILAQPVLDLRSASSDYAQVERQPLNPFTIIPDRPRNEIITYEVVRGDTINSIAERYGLQPNTIAWSNPRRIVQALFPGDIVNIPPVDGVLVDAIGGTRSVADYAALYKIDDPFIVLDSPYNAESLAGLSIDSIPPSGTPIFIPGGEAEQISWNPTVIREEGGGAGGSQGNFITFAPGEPGSCGSVANPGGGAFWAVPARGTITQGYSGYHTGIDISLPVGTGVAAANGGRVIFAGWNSYGYGYTVVLAHGPYTTLYGHLENNFYVGCGQDVSPGQIIAASGNSGRSSGPHLHFEIRFNDIPQNPAATIGF
ncbi:MAG: LysM peptidoglycan-binding domain-containing M23 family metallopeptidase [Aggregatilineales bacterium]